MSIHIEISENDTHRIITDIFDTNNPRIYIEEYRCTGCGEWFDEDEIIWANDDGSLSTDTGKSYCEGHCPEQPDY